MRSVKISQRVSDDRKMSVLDLSRFAYQKRKEPLFCREGKENQSTPNKAPCKSIPETPESLLPTPPSSISLGKLKGEGTHAPQWKRRNRVLSTSDEEEKTSTSRNLFSGLKASKRKKRDADEAIKPYAPKEDKNSEIVELSSDDETTILKPHKTESTHSKRKKNMLVFSFEETSCDDDVYTFEDGVQPQMPKKSHASVGKKSASVHGGTQGNWMGRRSKTMERTLQEHYQKSPGSQLEECGSSSEAVLASDEMQEHCSPKGSPIRPRKKFKRCRLMEFEDSPTTPKVPKVAVLEGDNSDSDDLPSVTTACSRKKSSRRLRMDSQDCDEGDEVTNCNHPTTIIIDSSDGEEQIIADDKLTSSSRKLSAMTSSHNGIIAESTKSKLQRFAFQPCKRRNNQETRPCVTSKEADKSGECLEAVTQSEQTIVLSGSSTASGTGVSNNGDEGLHSCCVTGTHPGNSDANMRDLNSHENTPSVEEAVETADLEELERNFEEGDCSGLDSDEGYSDKQKQSILEFLNSCTEEEACDMPGCSVTKARRIVSLQPFDCWEELVDTLSSNKGLSEQLLDSCLQLLGERKVLARLLSECQKISANIQNLISQLQDPEESTKTGCVCPSQPAIMSTSLQLKPYQLVGLNWLALMHSQNLNGILADEMGLGKTVQAIAFLAHLYEEGCHGPFLIVVPSSTIENWARELEMWCPTLRVVTYWGSQEDRCEIRYNMLYGEGEPEFEIILSTYNMCIGQPDDRKFFRKLSLQCLILDEGHMLKNMASQRYSYLMRIKARRRVLLTGTPLQNNLLELMSLLSFIMPDIFQKYSDQLKKTFSRAKKLVESSTYYQEQVGQAKQIMQPFILRRLKSEVLNQLPPKLEHTEYCPLNDLQQQLYTRIIENSRKELETFTGDNSYSKSLNVIMELRKIANHPLLVRHHYNNDKLRAMAVDILKDPAHRDADPQLVFEDMSVMSDFELHRLCLTNQVLSGYTLLSDVFKNSGKFTFLSQTLNEMKKQGDRVLLFSQFTMMLDIMECFLQQEGHTYLRLDGQTPVTRRQILIDQYNQSEESFVFLLSTRAGGLGINLTSANVVILHDIDFNPYNDKQAEDRCHRVGQKRDVHVIRLISKSTIEEDILHCAQKKLKLEQDISLTDELSKVDIASLIMQGLGSK